MAGPPTPSSSSDGRAGRWLVLVAGLAATVTAVVGISQLWPDDDPSAALATEAPEPTVHTTVPGAIGEPSERPIPPIPTPGATAHLFTSGIPEAFAELAAAAGDPQQVLELAIYDEYAFLAYRDPANPANIDRRMWRAGEVGEADANTGDDRVDADTEPALFSLAELDLTRLPAMLADAVTRYDLPVAVSHVLIDRFLPFDDRVLIRVYATPTDGRSGGGYVSYDTAGAFVEVCC